MLLVLQTWRVKTTSEMGETYPDVLQVRYKKVDFRVFHFRCGRAVLQSNCLVAETSDSPLECRCQLTSVCVCVRARACVCVGGYVQVIPGQKPAF